MKQITIRELGGEVLAELEQTCSFRAGEVADLLRHVNEFDFRALYTFVDVMMSILARHENTVIVNDSDLPVAPLEPIQFDE